MTVEMLARAPQAVGVPHRFLVLWQSRERRSYHRVGTLERDDDGYRFTYCQGAAAVPGFRGLASFPDLIATYRSADLWPTFANRVMTPRRDRYHAYIRSLGLPEGEPEPFEVLARTLGTRATDLFQLLPVPTVDDQGFLSMFFLVHGSRHVDPDAVQLAQLKDGDGLHLTPEDGNPASDVAVLVGRVPAPTADRALGYVPDVLGGLVRQLLDSGVPVRTRAEQVNLPGPVPVPDHMRLLVRLDAIVPPTFDPEVLLPA